MTPTEPNPETIWNENNIRTATPTQMTTLAWAIANTLSEVTHRVERANATNILNYSAQFDSYVKQKDDRPDATNIIEPLPVTELVVVNVNGWPGIVAGVKPVCARRIYIPVAVKPPDWFVRTGDGAAVDQFTGPVGSSVTKADGSMWMRYK